MDTEEFPLLHYQDLLLAMLRVAARGEAGLEDCIEELKEKLELAHEHPTIDREEMLRRLERARIYLVEARALQTLGNARFRITERGRRLLADYPKGVDDSVLLQFPEFRHFIHEAGEHVPPENARAEFFDRGYSAYCEGKRAADNPFETDTIKHLAWENGWFEALSEDLAARSP